MRISKTKFIGTPDYLVKEWKPIMDGWLKEHNIRMDIIKITLHDTLYVPVTLTPTIGCISNFSGLIHLSIKRDIKDIKFTLFHELGHLNQTMTGLSILRVSGTEDEWQADEFALALGIIPGRWLKKMHLRNYFTYDRKQRQYVRKIY